VETNKITKENKMAKFKVGDRVTRTTTSESPNNFGVVGKEYTVLGSIGGEIQVISGWWATAKYFELVTAPEYKVGVPYLWHGGDNPLPVGTLVKVRRGDKEHEFMVEKFSLSVYESQEVSWKHDTQFSNVVMFKVVSYPQPTREVTLTLTEEQIKAIEAIIK